MYMMYAYDIVKSGRRLNYMLTSSFGCAQLKHFTDFFGADDSKGTHNYTCPIRTINCYIF